MKAIAQTAAQKSIASINGLVFSALSFLRLIVLKDAGRADGDADPNDDPATDALGSENDGAGRLAAFPAWDDGILFSSIIFSRFKNSIFGAG